MHAAVFCLYLLSCSPIYGLVAMAVGASCIAFASAEMQEALGYGNWLKDIIGNDTVYGAMFIVSNIAAVAINIVGVKQCFKEGTLVACLDEDGNEIQKPIESVAVGTLVLAYDETTGEKAYKPVVQLFRNETKQWCTVCVEVDGKKENIISTPGHKYYLPFNTENRELGLKQEHESYYELSEKWVSAYKLKVGDKVLISDGKYGIIKSVKVESLSTSENTYNLEVADFHTYYVGTNPVCVHNSKCNGYDNHVIDKKDDLRIDLERGGSGKVNMHLHVGKTEKYMFDGQDSFIGAGKLNKTNFVKNGIKKGIKTAERLGWRL